MEVGAGGEHVVRVEAGRVALADHPAGAVAEHVHVRVGDGTDHALGHLLAGHPQLGVDAGDHQVQPGQHVVAVVQRAVLEDVHLDAGEDAERGQLLVEHGHVGKLLLQPLDAEAVGDGEAGRVVGQHHVLVAEGDRRAGHRLDGGTAVAPAGVQVEVALQRLAVDGAGVGEGDLGLAFQLGEVGDGTAGQRLLDDGGGRIADAVQVGEGAGGGPLRQLVGGGGPCDIQRPHERLGLEAGLVGAVEAVDHALQGLDRCHAGECRTVVRPGRSAHQWS